MLKCLLPTLLGLCLLLTTAGQSAKAEGKAMPADYLHPLFSDHAVLQREVPVPIWGQAPAGDVLGVSFAGQTKMVKVGADGRWSCTLDPMPASAQSRTLVVHNARLNQADRAEDILVGEVWLCSGQSNMEMGLTRAHEQEEIAKAHHPQLRLLTLPHEVAYKPQSSFDAGWRRCSPEAILQDNGGGFSAAAYFFGKKLQQELKVPVGLIHSSWGGTMIEAWTSIDALRPFPQLKGQLRQVEQLAASKDPKALDKMMDAWFMKHDPGTQEGWHQGTADTSEWRQVEFPGSWADCGIAGHEGVTWIQRKFKLPAHWKGEKLGVRVGMISDTDTTWINGVEVGRTNSFEEFTHYTVGPEIFKPGINVITLRITNAGGGGIFSGKAKNPLFIHPLRQITPGQFEFASLAGPWKLKTTATKAKTGRPIVGNPRVSSVLYHGMIAPLVPCALRGVIWYQGEANASQAEQYAKLLPAMIHDWRKQFHNDQLAFHLVSLAGYQGTSEQPRNHPWAELREAQAMTARNSPHCGLAVTVDIGDAKDIHPKNKRDVGLRLALSALAATYGKEVVGSGPWYRAMKIEKGRVRLEFDHAEGLQLKGPSDRAFAVAGANGIFHWAKPEVVDQHLILTCPAVPEPVAVRYAWDALPQAPLYNGAKLPAVPFRASHDDAAEK